MMDGVRVGLDQEGFDAGAPQSLPRCHEIPKENGKLMIWLSAPQTEGRKKRPLL